MCIRQFSCSIKLSIVGFILLLSIPGSGQNNRIWATYYGGNEIEHLRAITTDLDGNVFIGGITNSSNNIGSPNGFKPELTDMTDGFVAKFDSSGNRVWGTYYGGEGPDFVYGLTTDKYGNVYITGETWSDSGVVENGWMMESEASINAFLAKLDPDGNRVWATYFGGSHHFPTDGYGVAVDDYGNIFLTGNSSLPYGIAYNGFQDTAETNQNGFLVKFNPDGQREWSTLYGGDNGGWLYDVDTDSHGNCYVVGYSTSSSGIASSDFQNTDGGFADGILVKFAPDGDRLWARYFGGEDTDYAFNVAVDPEDNVYIQGKTKSETGIFFNGHNDTLEGIWDDYLAKFDEDGELLWSTYYGGSGSETHGLGSPEELGQLAVDAAGNVYLSGCSSSAFDIADGGYQNERIGLGNIYCAKFAPDGTRLCATYYGLGQLSEDYGQAMPDAQGNVYLTGTTSAVGPGISHNGFQNEKAGNDDCFLVKMTTCGSLSAGVISIEQPCANECEGLQLVAPSGGTPPYSFSWTTEPAIEAQLGQFLCPDTFAVSISDALDSLIVVEVVVQEGTSNNSYITQNADTMTASFGQSYQWYHDGVLIPGANEQTYVMHDNGYYHAEVGIGDCLVPSNTLEVTCICSGTSVADDGNKLEFRVFPNPTNGVIRFSYPITGELKVFDSRGKLVIAKRLIEDESIDVSFLGKGLYLVQVINNKKIFSASILK